LPLARAVMKNIAELHAVAEGVSLVDFSVDAVVEVIRLELAEVRGPLRRREELADELRVRVHRPADVHEQEHADVRLLGRAEDHLELAGVLRRLVDGGVEIELELRSLAGEGAELAQGDLDLADVEDEVRPV